MRPTRRSIRGRRACVALGLACAAASGCRLILPPRPDNSITSYQRAVAEPQPRLDTEGLDQANPLAILGHPQGADPQTGARGQTEAQAQGPQVVRLSLDEAITKALSNSPEIRVVSLDASIVEQEIVKSEADLDATLFGRYNYDQSDVPTSSFSEVGQSDVRTLESGVRQRITTGAEYSLSYALTRSWDDLVSRNPAKRYTPVLAFQLKQPLMRDGSREVTLAGIDIARLNHDMALLGFRQKADELATQVIALYWQLVQARQDLEIQQRLVQMASETFDKVQGRRQIDATDVQVQQAQVNAKVRQAQLLQAQRRVEDAQDALARLVADPGMDLVRSYEIIPDTPSSPRSGPMDSHQILATAIRGNPVLQQARLGVQIADINIRVAHNQGLPRLDLVASASAQALEETFDRSHDALSDTNYGSYAVGVVLEYPLGNRQREAEVVKRKLERKKAVAALQNLADQVAVQAKERLRRVETSFSEILVQQQAVEAANTQLQAIADSEPIRDRLTTEFLLVKLQAQESLAEAMRAQERATAEHAIALAELAQTMGTVLTLHPIQLPGQGPSGS